MEGIANAGVGIMIVRDGKFLLGKRHDDPEKADSALHGEGTWTMPGGKIDFGLSHVETAVKELAEETGLEVEPDDLEVFDISSNVAGDAHFITIGFLCRKFQGEPKVMEPDEIVEWKWFPMDKPPEPMFFPSEKMRRAYLNRK